jgi:type III restriction enzyme
MTIDYSCNLRTFCHHRYLQQNLIFGRPIQKLGTLLFCLDYAQQGGSGVAGVWKAVANVFAAAGMKDLYDDLKKVNEVRNKHVAHSEAPLDDPNKAVEAMGDWLRCINRMVKIGARQVRPERQGSSL